MILAIDPGNVYSAFVVLNSDYNIQDFGKVDNRKILIDICQGNFDYCHTMVVEMIASYGMAVGKEVFDTCVWIGKFEQAFSHNVKYIYRKEEKINLCRSMKAKDSNIRMALIDRFARHDFKNGKGTKANKDFFYGFKTDIWAAMAVAVTFLDKEKESESKIDQILVLKSFEA
ncbi:MAG: hypothetical protein H6Q71_1467 [Firmicutes bacterium]|nr:hypothetical protein [Bacillota bacterium]